MASGSPAKPPEHRASGSLGSPISFRHRRGSVASANSTLIDKEQLASALDRIHTEASRADSLTTFNDFAPPPVSTSTSENKGTTGDAVNQGFISLYSRFRDAVGAGGSPKKPPDAKDPEAESNGRTSRQSGTSLNRMDTAATASTMLPPDPASATHLLSGQISPTDSRSQTSQPSKGSSINLMTGSKSQPPNRQSFPTNATSSVVAEPPILTKEESTRSRLSTRESAEASARRSLSKVDMEARMGAGSDSILYDKDGRLPPRAQRDDTSSLASIDTAKSPTHPAVPHLPPIQTRHHRTPSGGSLLLSPDDIRRRPTAISRLSRSPSPGSRGSSTDRGTSAATPISIAANNNVYHESFSRASNLQRRSPRNVALEGASDRLTELAKMRNQVLNKEFWMKDDTVKECHWCQASFSAFRRKHHCRTCGFIFDSKCTLVISGSKFGVQGTLRVCKGCSDFISRRLDGSGSDDSGDDQTPVFSKLMGGGHHKSPSAAGRFKGKDLDVVVGSEGSEEARPISTPLMAIPATRRVRDSNRSSAVLEINAPQLSRPGSSRSLKSLASGRPQSSTGHKRHHSKHGFFGRYKERPEHQAPFRKGIDDESKKSKYPAFHEDNIIDPELAEYMSADESSGDEEQMGLFSAMSGSDLQPRSYENERSNLMGSYNASRKHRHRAGEKSISGISGRAAFDDVNGPASLLGHRRQTRRRHLSNVSGSAHYLPSPRPKSAVYKGPTASSEMLFSMDHQGHGHVSNASQVIRSDSLQQRRIPKVELKGAGLRHVYRILYQLLDDAGVHDPQPWQNALVPILLRATDDVDPNVPGGEDMDIRHYIKLKRIPGGKPGDTSYVSGVVFTKNLALKSMPRKISNPRIVLVRFPIEYHRHDTNLMSLQPVIQQEKEYLRVVVQRITNLRPHVLLAEKGVSGVALQYLNEANIAVVYNVKHTVIEAVSRCAETEVITSLDMLALPITVGRCLAFEVRTFVNNDYPGRKKSYIFISGCKPELGCTVSLRGANHALLAKIKVIVEFMVYVVYNLKLESSLLKNGSVEAPESGENSLSNSVLAVNDSFRSASNMSVVDHNGPTVVINNSSRDSQPPSQTTVQSSSNDTDNDRLPGQTAAELSNGASNSTELDKDQDEEEQGSQVPDDVPMPTYYSDLIAKYETKILSASPYVKFAQPYLLMKAREQERRLIYLKGLVDHDGIERREAEEQEANEKAIEEQREADEKLRLAEGESKQSQTDEDTTEPNEVKADSDEIPVKQVEEPTPKAMADADGSAQRFQLIKPEMVEKIGQKAPKQMMEILHAVHDAEYDKAMFNYQTQTRHWETYIQGNLDLFDPYAHQNIVVLYSVICTDTKIPCTEPGLVAFDFYNEQHYDADINPDCTLGQYIEDLVYSKDEICDSNGCERKMMRHHRTYVHDKSRITVFVEPLAKPPSGAPDPGNGITMWTYCKICKKDSEETAMSEFTFKYSFGKYLELLYWGRGLRMKDSVQCPHDHHKDHVRYFSLEDSRIRIHWDPIDLLEIVVPRARITWKVANDLKLKNEIYTKLEERWVKYINSVNTRLKGIRIDVILPEKAEVCREEVEQLTKKAQGDQCGIIRELQDIYVNTKYYEVVPFNKITRRMLEIASEWDTAFAKFEADYLGDKDMRQLTMLQLKKMFADNESKESLVSTEGSGSVGESDEPSQTFSEADEKSTQPTEFTENNSMETSVTSASRLNVGAHSVEEDMKVSIPAGGSIERIEPLDLAGSPVAIKNPGGQPHTTAGEGISLVPSPPKSPRPSPSPTKTGRATTDIPPTGQSLTERIDQKRREQAAKPESLGDANGAASTEEPKPERRAARRSGDKVSPPFSRAISQPARPMPRSQSSSGKANAMKQAKAVKEQQADQQAADGSVKVDKKLSERLGLSALKSRTKAGQSSIPRLAPKKRDTKVSTLAKHFEQLSREFERERIRDRKKRADSVRQPRAMLPRTATKAVVEVYDNVKEALEPHERGSEREGEKPPQDKAPVPPVAQEGPKPDQMEVPSEIPKADEAEKESKAKTPITAQPSQTASDDEGGVSDTEQAIPEEFMPDIKEIADSLEPSTEIPLELPKHQKTSLMKYLTNFWAERSASGWPMLDYPVTGNDHIFVDSDIIVREDEPSSVIALALNSGDYKDKLAQIRSDAQAAAQAVAESSDPETESAPRTIADLSAKGKKFLSMQAAQNNRDLEDQLAQNLSDAQAAAQTKAENSRKYQTDPAPVAAQETRMNSKELEESMLRATATHLKYQFKDGASVMTCKVFYAEQFDALRRKCGVAERIVESLSRCLKWDSKGGKTKSVFLKTLDDRLILKSLSPVETSAFLRFAPGYFSIMAEALFHDLPSVIAKMVGFFQVLIKNPSTGVDVRLDLLVTENLFYDRSPTRIFDLKGSMRNRKIDPTGEQNEVLLDENMVEFISESPLFAREHSKKLLRASVWNDTLFLASQDVMDYSLMIAVDEDRKELVVGIIDCIRTYTWDKKLESWIKDRGFAGGGRNRPTVTSPKEYKNRFREAMARYILQSPTCWHLFNYPSHPHHYSRTMIEDAENKK